MRKIILIVLCVVLIFSTSIFTLLIMFPKKYCDLIIKYSNEFNLDSYIVASVINIESGYDKDAISSMGAVGLMQLLPSTAEEIASKITIKDFDLTTPEDNIKMGCYYLSYLLKIFDNNLINSLCAYNWGLSNVKSWLDKGNYDALGTITNIPVKETSDYVKNFKLNSYIYKKIYGF